MDTISQYNTVVVKPGVYRSFGTKSLTLKKKTTGSVVEILGEQDLFLVDIGNSPDDWDTIEVKKEDLDSFE